MGYNTPYTLINFGFPTFILPFVSLGLIILKTVSFLPFPKLNNLILNKLIKKAVWNFYLIFFNEMYFNMSICTLLQYTALNFDDFGYKCNLIVCLTFSIILVTFPIITTGFYFKNFSLF